MKMHLGVCVPFFVLSTLANEDISSTARRPYPPRLSRRRPLLHPPVVEVIGLTQGLIVMLSIQLYKGCHDRCLAGKTATACWWGWSLYHFVNNIWTIRQWDNHIIVKSSHHFILRFSDFWTNLSYAMQLVFFQYHTLWYAKYLIGCAGYCVTA